MGVRLAALGVVIVWTYTYRPSTEARPCCGRVNRGVAILGDSLFMGTIDGRLVALDAKTGRERWNVAVEGARPEAGYAFTVAPLVVKDEVIAGTAGGDFGSASSSRRSTRRRERSSGASTLFRTRARRGNETWSGDSRMHGGGAIWTTGSSATSARRPAEYVEGRAFLGAFPTGTELSEPAVAERRTWRRPRARPEDRGEDVGVHDAGL